MTVDLFPEIDVDVCKKRITEARAQKRDIHWEGLTRNQARVMVGLLVRDNFGKKPKRRDPEPEPDWL